MQQLRKKLKVVGIEDASEVTSTQQKVSKPNAFIVDDTLVPPSQGGPTCRGYPMRSMASHLDDVYEDSSADAERIKAMTWMQMSGKLTASA